MEDLEIEIKAYCDNHKTVIEKVLSLGGRLISSEMEEDLYFNHPCRDFKSTDEAFRIRKRGDSVAITYKGPRLPGRSKTRIEEEMPIADHGTMKKILHHLGFIEVCTVRKERDIYRVDDIEVCLDKVMDLGNFVELEKKGTDRVSIEEELFILADKLGLSRFETKSYLELVLSNT